MLIGSNFDKLEQDVFGFHILEPNVILSNVVMAATSFVLAYKMRSIQNTSSFSKMWYWFFMLYGFSSLGGALGHGFYLYWGIWGKISTWISAPIAVLLIELALASLYPNKRIALLLKRILYTKLVLLLVSILAICIFLPVKEKPEIGFLPVAINTIVGLISTAGILGYLYSKQLHKGYLYFLYGVLTMVPSAIFFLGKINLHPWLDKNDVSHYLLSAGIVFFYVGVLKTVNDHSSIKENTYSFQ